MKYLLILLFLPLFLLPLTALGAGNSDDMLTLLTPPQKNTNLQQQPQPAGQPQELRDIHGPVELKNQSRMLIYAAAITLLFLLLLIIYLLKKRRKKTSAPSIPPWEKALSDLTEARQLLSSNLALHYMNKVSLILRNYVESRFAIKSTRQTTREFLSNLNRSSADPMIKNCKGELQTCLEQCDMAKFAHQIPLQQNMKMTESAIISFIEKTRPTPGQKGETP